ncbi:hypothetical protein Hanom_Chr04g00312091 [Helianthus anomalus]
MNMIMVGLPYVENREKILTTLLAKEQIDEGLYLKEVAKIPTLIAAWHVIVLFTCIIPIVVATRVSTYLYYILCIADKILPQSGIKVSSYKAERLTFSQLHDNKSLMEGFPRAT